MNKRILTIGVIVLTTVVLKKLLGNKNKTIKGSYQVPTNIPNRLDALHAFESRKLDGFGGKMSTTINAALRKLYNKGINPDLKKIDIVIDPILFKVDWSAEIGPSKDGIAYENARQCRQWRGRKGRKSITGVNKRKKRKNCKRS